MNQKRMRTTELLLINVALVVSVILWAGGCSSGEKSYTRLREEMVRKQIARRGIGNDAVLASMRKVPRHHFVPEEYRAMAYVDHPLPIGEGQTISQPYIVALMTSSLDLDGGERVLEIGTGSGYQAAVLAEIVDSVFTMEIIPELVRGAGETLDSLGYDNVLVRVGDGYYGWPEKAPFDGIMVTAAAPEGPSPLIDQLKEGGRLVIPIGDFLQHLHVYQKKDDHIELISTLPVRFVPMKGRIRESKE
jgi:protein-L-isoaspartate(D-aspartate) O-methyltransferase